MVSSSCCCPVAQSYLIVCDPMHASLPCPSLSPRVCSNSCPLSEWCHPAISSSAAPSPASNLSHHQGVFEWVSSLHQVAKVLELQLQHQSFRWIFRLDFLFDWLIGSPCNPRDSQDSSLSITIRKHQFFGAQPSFWSNSQIYMWLLEKQLWL